MKISRKRALSFFLVFLTLSLIFLAHYSVVGQAVYGDSIYYWAYTRSLVIDQDLNLRNEGNHTYSPETNNKNMEDNYAQKGDLTKTKYFPIGSSLFWVPFFFLAHEALYLLRLLGNSLPMNGYSDSYQIAVGLGNIFFVVTGLFLLYETLLFLTSRRVALFSSILLLGATNVLYYASIDVVNSHSASFFLSCVFVYTWIKIRGRKRFIYYFLLGTLIGLLTLVRTQDILFFSILLVQAGIFIWETKKKRLSAVVNQFKVLTVAFFGFLVGFFPQLITSKIFYGSFSFIPHIGNKSVFSVFNIAHPRLLEIILDPHQGILYFTPVLLLAIFGLFLIPKKYTAIKLGVIMLFLLEYFTVASWSAWAQGEAFGMRMFISLIPLLGIGLSFIITRIQKYLSKTVLFILVASFVLHTIVSIMGFHLFLHNPTYIGSDISRSGKIKMEILQKLQSLKLFK